MVPRSAADGIALTLHGGAGRIERGRIAAGVEREMRAVAAELLRDGLARLASGASALDVAQAVVVGLEDSPHFNAGRGSALTSEGVVEMDAALMDGSVHGAGAVTCVRRVRNPILLARCVLDEGRHVLLAGEGAERMARERGLLLAGPEWLVTAERREELERARAGGRVSLDRDEGGALGTVGAVARDARGHLAAATSTGGMTNKSPGRVGDSPLVGAGTWADDATCAVSATGEGELFIRAAFAHEVDAALRLGGMTLAAACDHALARVSALGGTGGCIALAPAGAPVARFTTVGMVRGFAVAGAEPGVALYGDEIL